MTIVTGDGFDISDNGSSNNGNSNGGRGKKQRKTANHSSNQSKTEDKPADAVETDTAEKDTAEKAAAKTDTAEDATAEEATAEKGTAEKPVEKDSVPSAVTPLAQTGTPASWSAQQIISVARQILAVFVVLGIVGYALGAARGSSNTARAEFVYSLDESIPDSFLREDRRLLTQLVTFKSDAVLTPVAAEFDLTVDGLRSKIDVATLELSEVIRLDVSDADADRAVAINRAVLNQYLTVITDATPADDGQGLAAQRAKIADQLAVVDASGLALVAAQGEDITLELRQESVQRQVELKSSQINLLRQTIGTADVQGISATQLEKLVDSLDTASRELVSLEADLIAISTQRAELATATVAQPALAREIERLESRLATVDAELAQRELGPLVASPIRELSSPLVVFHSSHLSGLQGMAVGLLLAVPLAALLSYRSRKSQLWSD